MNSSLFEFLLCQITNTPPGGFLKLHTEYTGRLPIMPPDEEPQADLESLAEETLALEDPQKADIQPEIDSIVFHVYGLSVDERRLVLDWLSERREALGAEMPPEWRKLNALRATAGRGDTP